MHAVYEPLDLARLTADLAAAFRNTCARAGLSLVVDIQRSDASAEGRPYVDRDMWELIVLNLLSNACKHTSEGEIAVLLREQAGLVELTVRDTGAGIPADAIPHLFERFYRVDGVRGPAMEGTGIGLSVVQDLVRLHGGIVHVSSTLGVGSTFTVSIPLGCSHLPEGRILMVLDPTAASALTGGFLEQSLGWGADSGSSAPIESTVRGLSPDPVAGDGSSSPPAGIRRRILWADDQEDIRPSTRELLAPTYDVETFSDGACALEAALAHPPDLVLADIMMPGLDGFGLLRRLHADERTREVPVILISALAGEEARIEGLRAGAADYILKPFPARELLARVDACLEAHRLRREAEQRITRILESISDGFVVLDAGWRITYMNRVAKSLFAAQDTDPAAVLGRHLLEEVFPDARRLATARPLLRAMEGRRPAVLEVHYPRWNRWYSLRCDPLADGGLAIYFRDVTDEKAAEEVQQRLQRERDELLDRLQLQFDRMPIACIVFDARSSIIDWNPAAERTFGHKREDVLGKVGPTILVSPPVHESLQDMIAKLAAGETATHSVNENVTSDGRTIICEWHNTPLRDFDGNTIGFLSMAQDITERRRAEEQLRASRERFAADLADSARLQEVSTRLVPAGDATSLLLEIVDVAISITRADMGSIQLLDRTAGQLRIVASRGFDAPFLTYFETVPCRRGGVRGRHGKPHRIVIEEVSSTRVLGREALAVILAAGVRSLQSTPLIARSGRLVGILSTHYRERRVPTDRDLHRLDQLARQAADWIERTEAEAALHVSEERFRLATEALAGFLYDRDMATDHIEYFGDSEAVVGWRTPEIPTKARWWLDRVHADDLTSAQEASERAVRNGAAGWSLEYRVRHRDGHYVDVAEEATIVRDGAGAVIRVVGGMRDISERRAFERERESLLERERQARAAAEAAANALVQAEVALERHAANLERSNAELEQFAYVASHDLQEPLRTIGSYVELLAERYGEHLDARGHRWIRYTVQGVEHMRRFIAGLLALARVRSDDKDLRPTDMLLIVEGTWAQLWSAHRLADASLTHDALPTIIADPIQIDQLFQNLVGNAVKYRRADVSLQVHVSAELRLLDAGAEWAISVRDNGIGLDMAQATRIFELFQRVHQQDGHEGSGIGLAICRKIVERHGGRIWVESAVGEGSTFHFTLRHRPA
jgi:PAS domain S-box-containing protein